MNFIPLAFFEQRYAISSEGVVLNLANNTTLTPIQNPNGYLKVGLALGNGQHKQASLHVLVAKHFLPNPYGHSQVNHIDGDKRNNAAANLEWVTAQQNIHHALKAGLRPGYMSADDKEAHLHRVLAGEQVKDIALEISRRPETLHKMLRETAKRLELYDAWQEVMKRNRKDAALRNLEKINS